MASGNGRNYNILKYEFYHSISYIDKAVSWFQTRRLSPDRANSFPTIVSASCDDATPKWLPGNATRLLGNMTPMRSASWAGLQIQFFVTRRDDARL